MDFLAIDIKVGLVGAKAIPSPRLEFHDKVVRMLFPGAKETKRLGMDYSSSIDHFNYVHNPGCINHIIQEAVSEILNSGHRIEACIVDFTDNPFIAVREPLLLALFTSIMVLCRSATCKSFAVLLPELVGSESASAKYLEDFSQGLANQDYTVTVIANSGESVTQSSTGVALPKIQGEYAQAITQLYGTPSVRLERKCVRRLGHFSSYNPLEGKIVCRQYSYLLHDCSDELEELFREWWSARSSEKHGILFDLKNNEPFRRAVQAIGQSDSVFTARILDVLEEDYLADKAKGLDSCVLVLDAIETGATLAAYADELRLKGIRVCPDVVVAINKTGAKESKVREFNIHGLLARQRGPAVTPCVQCLLGLPHTAESHESLAHIRSFDMLQMAHESGYELEPIPEVPDGRLQYPLIPAFLKILSQFGDWIAYKIECVLRAANCPEDLCIIHPDESQSTAMVDKMEELLGHKYFIIKVPRELISEAQTNSNAWQPVLSKHSETHLIRDLQLASKSSALILDIFRGSGGTCASLEALLGEFGIEPFAYFCFVDFDPREGDSTSSGLHTYSLYQWYNPRELLNIA
jgi:hypothetical protein